MCFHSRNPFRVDRDHLERHIPSKYEIKKIMKGCQTTGNPAHLVAASFRSLWSSEVESTSIDGNAGGRDEG